MYGSAGIMVIGDSILWRLLNTYKEDVAAASEQRVSHS
jgi:hypothetical protein